MISKEAQDLEIMAQCIYDAAEKLNYPDGYRIYLYLKSNNQHVPYKVIREVYDKENTARQLFTASAMSDVLDKRALPRKQSPI
jgi:hypothetical protein